MINVLHRSSLRGLIKCKECHCYNGTRALACKNPKCSLSNVKKAKRKTALDTIRLISKTETNLYSVQVRERDPNLRDFVSITDKIISSDETGSIISRNAICYIDTCKYDSNDINISCKHVKNSVESTDKEATSLAIDSFVLNSLKISDKLKETLWKLYEDSEANIPMVQRINRNMFVVRCDVSLTFPAGLLHVIFNMHHNDVKDTSYSCSCKIINCDHFLLVLAALLSNETLKTEFKRHVAFFGDLVDLSRHNSPESTTFASSAADNILSPALAITDMDDEILDHVFVPSDVIASSSCPSTATVIDNLDNIELIHIPTTSISDGVILNQNNSKDDLSEPIELQTDIPSMEMDSIRIVNEDANIQNLELIDCQIELMDQFNLTDHIEFSNEEIQLQEDDDYLRVENICDMPDLFNIYHNTIMVEDELGANDLMADISPSASKRRKHSVKLKKSTKTMAHDELLDDKCESGSSETANLSEKFTNWLDSVIETINMTMDYTGNGRPDPLVFRIPHAFFERLRQRFTVGSRKRLPSNVKAFQSGKYKNLTMFCWKFTNVNLLKCIFKTENMSLDIEKSFEEISGNFKVLTRDKHDWDDLLAQKPKAGFRKIRPTDYRTFLKIRVSQNGRKISDERDGEFVIQWIPFVLPKSKYGDLIIKFQYGHMKNGKIVNLNELQSDQTSIKM